LDEELAILDELVFWWN